MKLVLALPLFFLFSCASYVDSLHRQIESDERRQMRPANNPQQRQKYLRPGDRSPIKNPITLESSSDAQYKISQNTNNNYYNRDSTTRYSADDLKDNQRSGSLWSDDNGGTFLFITNENIKRGDFLIVEVLSTLKNEIQEELDRTFPQKPKSASADTPEEEITPPKAADDPEKVYDKISTQVFDEVNQNYLFVKGRKEIMFRGMKRLIEIQAIVPKKDIKDADTVRSDKLLQPRIFALRY